MKNTLRSRGLDERFLISYDNMGFNKNVAAQRMHNRVHQTNYPAGYILFWRAMHLCQQVQLIIVQR